ncbi:DNA glycosylase AlkZ-like family protein [Actinomadura rugatobispora]|uniref:DNA glycosylase AlkZ-like family protein n=1 Tax=Actinomadura rugatobispora TaxID=1994 RepID=A0ABW1A370_9ACTN|nr:winged helix DNA-binding domain-containing protein [Actinomadura rugatobispora]
MKAVTWPQVLAWRMRRQFLEPAGGAPAADVPVAEVVRRLAGVQAQVASAAALAVAVRRAGPVPGEVARALWEERSLVKTWAARGTLHLLPAAEAPAHLALCATARHWERPSWQRTFGATPADLEAIAAAARTALSGGAALTREELTAAIVEETGSGHLAEVLGSGWGTLLKPLAWWGVLCYGPSRSTRVTFAAPERTVPGWTAPPPPEEAARTVLPAYLGAHGPATPEAFDNWLTRKVSRKKDLKGWFAAVEDRLATVEVEGVPMQVLREHLDELLDTPPTRSVRLVGGFDQYVLGAGTGAAYLVPAGRRAEVSRTAGWISPVVLYEGRVAGVWAAEDGDIAVTPFEDVPSGPLAEEAARMRALLAS